jgi:hypothetical protein
MQELAMKTLSHSLLLLVLVALISCAQLVTAQSIPPAQALPPADAAKPASTVEDISGMYTFLREGEFVQINIEDGNAVTGFVSRYGDSDGDKGSFLDQFFSKASFDGKHLTFATKPVHSIWFEFDGNVQRGTGKTPKEEAYRVVHGKLTQFTTESSGKVTSKSRDLDMKSFPQDFEEETAAQPKKD